MSGPPPPFNATRDLATSQKVIYSRRLAKNLRIKPAERSSLLGFSDIVKIRNRVLEMKAAGQKVLQLEGGEPFMPTPDFVKKAMVDAMNAEPDALRAVVGSPAAARSDPREARAKEPHR